MTREQAAKWLPIIEAYAAGKTVEWLYAGMWVTKTSHYIFDEEPEKYRIRPEPKLRAWKPEEVPVGTTLIRAKNNGSMDGHYHCHAGCKHLIISCGSRGLTVYVGGEAVTLDLGCCFKNCEYSTDGGKTWHPCGVLE